MNSVHIQFNIEIIHMKSVSLSFPFSHIRISSTSSSFSLSDKSFTGFLRQSCHLHGTDVMTVTAAWYLSINNTQSLKDVSGELHFTKGASLKERGSTLEEHARLNRLRYFYALCIWQKCKETMKWLFGVKCFTWISSRSHCPFSPAICYSGYLFFEAGFLSLTLS